VTRPAVSVVVPFLGTAQEARAVGERFAAVRLDPGDERVIADNGEPPAVPGDLPGFRVVRAREYASAGCARNAGAAAAGGEWILFCDADVEPAADLVERYFDPPPDARVGILAGAVVDHPEGDTLAARLARETEAMSQRATLANPFLPYALTANCAFRAEAFRAAGGFVADVQWGEDADLCWKLQRLGWALEERPDAVVHHRNRETLRAVWRQRARHGRGAAWLDRRWPGSMPRWGFAALARDSARRLAGGVRARARGERGQAALEAAVVSAWWAYAFGRLTPNRAQRRA
jgi:GT2 family glycosyltransferase